jgi:hypothetical protein
VPKIAFLLAIGLATLSLSDTALASHKGREECIALCLYQFKQMMQGCESEVRYSKQVCYAGATQRETSCERHCYIVHPDVPG